MGATLLDVLSSYANEIASKEGRLYLVGVRPEVRAQIDRTQRLDLKGPGDDSRSEIQHDH